MKILAGFNGSAVSKAALDLALNHAKAFNAQLFVAISAVGGSRQTIDDVRAIDEIANVAKGMVAQKNVDAQINELIRGMSPGEDLVNYARENDIDLIYVGIEKRSRTQKILLGSNAQYIILKAHCPVMTVK